MTVKRKMKKLFVVFILVAGACGKSLPTLDGIDLKQWKDDKNGCGHYREKTIDLLASQFDKLKALDETQISQLFGKPDQTELYRRNQKFYTYFLEPSVKCNPLIEKTKKLVIRFNGTRIAKEFEIE
jgi:outer membrane protein assembly factor BamE (lipoprotein component of BamABCDE complex)